MFAFGDAKKHGLVSGKTGSPIVGAAETNDGGGYWLVSRAGKVFAFGDAKNKGSLAGAHVTGTVVAIMADPVGNGYWLVDLRRGHLRLRRGGAPPGTDRVPGPRPSWAPRLTPDGRAAGSSRRTVPSCPAAMREFEGDPAGLESRRHRLRRPPEPPRPPACAAPDSDEKEPSGKRIDIQRRRVRRLVRRSRLPAPLPGVGASRSGCPLRAAASRSSPAEALPPASSSLQRRPAVGRRLVDSMVPPVRHGAGRLGGRARRRPHRPRLHGMVGFGGEGLLFDGERPVQGINPRHNEATWRRRHRWRASRAPPGGCRQPVCPLGRHRVAAPRCRTTRGTALPPRARRVGRADRELESAWTDLRSPGELADALGPARPHSSRSCARSTRSLSRSTSEIRGSLVAQHAPLGAAARRHRPGPLARRHGSRPRRTSTRPGYGPSEKPAASARRTFSSAIALMDEQPDFVFVCSQAQQHAWMQEDYPSLFAA